jgi:hypothetical protein
MAGTGGSGCVARPERCDGRDNDCNGIIDDAPSICPRCYQAWRGGSAYLFCTELRSTWSSALARCRRLGYHLVTISDFQEDAWVFAEANKYSNDRWWIGFNDRNLEGTWEWVDGSAVSYQNWEPGEPNNQGNEDCGQINRFYPVMTWNDEPCETSLPYACEAP